ncbi:Serine/threonine-protein kinase PknH [Mycobacterium persicum]|uniref:Serine/threonine-protein kinase PknH n=2 Tax=Mycobacterium persicum TaxID=1487726 RepID=A0ABY6RSN9_9MYCO|nr:Serine/threonine-protein kinase PknH [Mycobacterium persicum]
MPDHPHWHLTDKTQPAPTPHRALQPTATPAGPVEAPRSAHRPGQTPFMGSGPGEQVTAVLPRRPFLVAGGPPVPPARPGMPTWGPVPGSPPDFIQARRRRFPKWAPIAAGAAVMVTLVGASMVINLASSTDNNTASSTRLPAPTTSTPLLDPVPTPQPPTVPLSALPGLMLDVATINSIEGTTDIAPIPGDIGKDDYAFSGVSTDRGECSEIHAPALVEELDNSGWVGVRTQSLADPKGATHINHSAAIYFATAKAANDFAAKQAQAWRKCNGATLHVTERGYPSSIWIAGTATDHQGMLSITNIQEGGGGWQCQRALTARNNIVIDVRSCGKNRTDQAITIATRMAARVTPR